MASISSLHINNGFKRDEDRPPQQGARGRDNEEEMHQHADKTKYYLLTTLGLWGWPENSNNNCVISFIRLERYLFLWLQFVSLHLLHLRCKYCFRLRRGINATCLQHTAQHHVNIGETCRPLQTRVNQHNKTNGEIYTVYTRILRAIE